MSSKPTKPGHISFTIKMGPGKGKPAPKPAPATDTTDSKPATDATPATGGAAADSGAAKPATDNTSGATGAGSDASTAQPATGGADSGAGSAQPATDSAGGAAAGSDVNAGDANASSGTAGDAAANGSAGPDASSSDAAAGSGDAPAGTDATAGSGSDAAAGAGDAAAGTGATAGSGDAPAGTDASAGSGDASAGTDAAAGSGDASAGTDATAGAGDASAGPDATSGSGGAATGADAASGGADGSDAAAGSGAAAGGADASADAGDASAGANGSAAPDAAGDSATAAPPAGEAGPKDEASDETGSEDESSEEETSEEEESEAESADAPAESGATAGTATGANGSAAAGDTDATSGKDQNGSAGTDAADATPAKDQNGSAAPTGTDASGKDQDGAGGTLPASSSTESGTTVAPGDGDQTPLSPTGTLSGFPGGGAGTGLAGGDTAGATPKPTDDTTRPTLDPLKPITVNPAVPSPADGLTTPVEEPVLGEGGQWTTKQHRWIPNPADPKSHPNRTLVLCFDGTGDQYDDDNSNVVQLTSFLKKDDHSKQMVYYQTGIGTDTDSTFLRNTSKAIDLMFAASLGHHVRQGYEFLVQNYQEGDVICIFGFSRGAYTARALAGMVQKVGVLPPWNRQMIPFAYHMFSQTDLTTLKLCDGFRKTFSIEVKIEFVGVWDTVASVGLVPRYLPFVASNNCIRYFRHAVALDEHRAKFAPSYYRQSKDKDEKNKSGWEAQERTAPKLGQLIENTAPLPTGHVRLVDSATASATKTKAVNKSLPPKKTVKREDSLGVKYEEKKNKESGQKTDALEVWFAGVHTDVGGGSVPNHTRHSLARIPLRWMIRECFKCCTGIIFDADMLQNEAGMDINWDKWQVMDSPAPLSPGDYYRIRRSPMHPVVSAAREVSGSGSSAIELLANLMPGPMLNRAMTALFSPVKTSSAPIATPGRLVNDTLEGVFGATTTQKGNKPEDAAYVGHAREPFKGEAVEELLDALSPIYDQLHLAPPWWFLEWLPLKVKKEKAIYSGTDSADAFKWLQNNGEGRKVFKFIVSRGMLVHRSVDIRLKALDESGRPGSYAPLIRPNIVVKNEKGEEDHAQFREMRHDEWLSRNTDTLNQWYRLIH